MVSIDFDKRFPKLVEALRNYKEIVQWQKHMDKPDEEKKTWEFAQPGEYYDDVKHKFLPLFNDELVELIPEWKNI